MSETLYCANHPNVETALRCNRCEKPICTKCAVHTPTGYRCKECVRGLQKNFENVIWYDYIIGFVSSAFLSAIASVLVSLVSMIFFGLIVLFIAPTAGALIASGVQIALRRHRSRLLFQVCAGGVIAGAIPTILISALPPILMITSGQPQGAIFTFLPLIWQIVYLVIATPIVYSQLSGIRFTK